MIEQYNGPTLILTMVVCVIYMQDFVNVWPKSSSSFFKKAAIGLSNML